MFYKRDTRQAVRVCGRCSETCGVETELGSQKTDSQSSLKRYSCIL